MPNALGISVTAAALLLILGRFADFHTGKNTLLVNTFLYSLVVVLVSSILVVALAHRGPICALLRWAPLRFVGQISYSMYLIHVSAIIVAVNLFGKHLAGFLTALGLTILYATLCWFGFEKRLLQRGRRPSLSPA